jgi:hypothetical protein
MGVGNGDYRYPRIHPQAGAAPLDSGPNPVDSLPRQTMKANLVLAAPANFGLGITGISGR